MALASQKSIRANEELVGGTKTRTASSTSDKRAMGAYYTPSAAADYMADWIIRNDGEHILEPSFGEGIFLRSVGESAIRRGFNEVRITGIEIDTEALRREERISPLIREDLRYEDFLAVAPTSVNSVIGNPPYVRLRHLPEDQRQRAIDAAHFILDQPMEPSGSVWMPFVLHAMRFLCRGGRMALVLPYELTYVRYARPLWDILSNRFGSLRVVRTHERLFPDILQDVVILFADEYRGHTKTVRYQAYERVDDLPAERSLIDEQILIKDLLQGERPFLEALLGNDLRELLRTRIAPVTKATRDFVAFNIGYVSGDKTFFHPDYDTIRKYKLPDDALHLVLSSTRGLRGKGLRTTELDPDQMERLFFPENRPLTIEEKEYVEFGEQQKVNKRYKCQVRDPWYIVPGVRRPDLILSVFSERPILLLNDAHYFASNSLLCGFLREHQTSEAIAMRWYTSLTLLQCELQVHALGGGVMVMIPGEVGNIRLPAQIATHTSHLECLDHLMKQGETVQAYRAGDQKVLMAQLGLDEAEISLIHHGIDMLTHWRTSARTSLDYNVNADEDL